MGFRASRYVEQVFFYDHSVAVKSAVKKAPTENYVQLEPSLRKMVGVLGLSRKLLATDRKLLRLA